MNEEDSMRGNLKVAVFKSFPYEELQRVVEAIIGLGYSCEFIDNGNIVFTKIKEKKNDYA